MSRSKFKRGPDGRTRRKRGKASPFVMLHWYMLDSEAWRSLSGIEAKGYVAIARRYNGANNGKIGVPTRWLARELGCSNDTAARVIRTLVEKGFLEIVVASAFNVKNRKAAEYRLTIYHCDVTNKAPSKEFMRWHPQSDPSDCAAPAENFLQSDLKGAQSDPSDGDHQRQAPRYDPSDCEPPNSASHSTTHRTHLESTTSPSAHSDTAADRRGSDAPFHLAREECRHCVPVVSGAPAVLANPFFRSDGGSVADGGDADHLPQSAPENTWARVITSLAEMGTTPELPDDFGKNGGM